MSSCQFVGQERKKYQSEDLYVSRLQYNLLQAGCKNSLPFKRGRGGGGSPHLTLYCCILSFLQIKHVFVRSPDHVFMQIRLPILDTMSFSRCISSSNQ